MNERILVRNGPLHIGFPKGLTQSRARPFFNRATGRTFDVQAGADATDIELYDEIGYWGVTATEFRRTLKATKGGDINLRINSPGGDVFDGITIFNDLVDHPGTVNVHIVGLAASAASFIALAGDTVSMADNAFIMIHNAWTFAVGDRHELAAGVNLLEQIDGSLADTYAKTTELSREEAVQFMDDETWFTAEKAEGYGFITSVVEEVDAKAKFDLSCFKNLPSQLKLKAEQGADNKDPTIRDLERVLTQDAGLSRSKARAILRNGTNANEVMPGADDDSEAWAALAVLSEHMKRNIP